MVLTTVFLVTGLSVMMISEFLGLMHMCLFIIVILIGALLGDLLLLRCRCSCPAAGEARSLGLTRVSDIVSRLCSTPLLSSYS
jgi:hypothetical protein